MTVQHPRTSAIESATQAVVGVLIGFSVSFVVISLHLSTALSAWLITAIMFFVSILRGYLIRRWFERRVTDRHAMIAEMAKRCAGESE